MASDQVLRNEVLMASVQMHCRVCGLPSHVEVDTRAGDDEAWPVDYDRAVQRYKVQACPNSECPARDREQREAICQTVHDWIHRTMVEVPSGRIRRHSRLLRDGDNRSG